MQRGVWGDGSMNHFSIGIPPWSFQLVGSIGREMVWDFLPREKIFGKLLPANVRTHRVNRTAGPLAATGIFLRGGRMCGKFFSMSVFAAFRQGNRSSGRGHTVPAERRSPGSTIFQSSVGLFFEAEPAAVEQDSVFVILRSSCSRHSCSWLAGSSPHRPRHCWGCSSAR